jgi:hypothetical protein
MNNSNPWLAKASRGKVKMVAIVRDSEGKPKFDDPHNVPQAILDVLTEDDLRHLEKLKQET